VDSRRRAHSGRAGHRQLDRELTHTNSR
jgi:hypothetical protein